MEMKGNKKRLAGVETFPRGNQNNPRDVATVMCVPMMMNDDLIKKT